MLSTGVAAHTQIVAAHRESPKGSEFVAFFRSLMVCFVKRSFLRGLGVVCPIFFYTNAGLQVSSRASGWVALHLRTRGMESILPVIRAQMSLCDSWPRAFALISPTVFVGLFAWYCFLQWRVSKTDVGDQLVLPPQDRRVYWLQVCVYVCVLCVCLRV